MRRLIVPTQILMSYGLAWTFFIFYNLLLYWNSLRPSEEIPTFLMFWGDKPLHTLVYGILFLISARAFFLSPLRQKGKVIYWACTYAFLTGLGIEGLQFLFVYRTASLMDILANAAGIGIALYAVITQRARLPVSLFR
jgi:VanZ family protein